MYAYSETFWQHAQACQTSCAWGPRYGFCRLSPSICKHSVVFCDTLESFMSMRFARLDVAKNFACPLGVSSSERNGQPHVLSIVMRPRTHFGCSRPRAPHDCMQRVSKSCSQSYFGRYMLVPPTAPAIGEFSIMFLLCTGRNLAGPVSTMVPPS
jgi:hypothetical protein